MNGEMGKCKRAKFFLILSLWMLGTVPVWAQNDEESFTEFMELSLEELMNIQVTTASRKAESNLQAPSAITVITEDEIKAYGGLTLQDILDRVVGAWTYGTLTVPNSIYTIRGVPSSLDNLQVLVLIDGKQTRENLRNGQNTVFYQTFSLDRIKQIEVIRGPGSVLHGSGAYMGVINIITKKGAEQGFTSQLRYGSRGSYQLNTAFGKDLGNLKLAAGINFFNLENGQFTLTDENDQTGSYDQFQRGASFDVNLSSQRFRFSAMAGDNRQNTVSNKPIWVIDNRNTGEDTLGVWHVNTPRVFANVGYDIVQSDKLDLSVDVINNYFKYDNEYPGIGYERFQTGWSNSFMVEAVSNYRPSDKLDFSIGGNINVLSGGFKFYYQSEEGDPYPILSNSALPGKDDIFDAVPVFNETWFAFFGQVNYQVLPKLKLVAGAQMNKVPDISPDLVPRAAVVYSVSDFWGVKGMVSSAFRAPIGLQKDVKNAGTLWGNPNLNPEKNTTYEFQVYNTTPKISTTLTFYHIRQKDLVLRSKPADSLLIIDGISTPTFINSGALQSTGVELEGKVRLSPRLFMNFGMSYSTNENEAGDKEVLGTPNTMIKSGLSYKVAKGLDVSIFNTYSSAPNPADAFNSEGIRVTRDNNPDPESFHWLSLNVDFDITETFFPSSKTHFLLNLYGSNLVGKEIWHPEYVRRNINSMQVRGGRSLYVALKVRI